MTAVLNRPWLSSFNFDQTPYSDAKLDQFHKLARNFIVSLPLGCPSVKHVHTSLRYVPNSLFERDPRAEYLAWVKDWKKIYKELSRIIRMMKSARRTVRYPKPTAEQIQICENENRGLNVPVPEHLRKLSGVHLERLQETAMAMLNARWNARLAAGMRYQDELIQKQLAELQREAQAA